MKPYVLQYWAYNPDDDKTTVLRSKDVLVDSKTLTAMTSAKEHQFFKFKVEDGEDFFIGADYIHSLTRDYK